MPKTSNRFRFNLLLFALLLFLFLGGAALAKSGKPAFEPKTGTEGKALMFSHLGKRFIINRNTPIGDIDKIGQIENAEFVFDGLGEFPPKSTLVRIAETGRPLTLILPLEFSKAHLRRLSVLNDYTVQFRIDASTFSEETARNLTMFGPRRLVLEIKTEDLSSALATQLAHIRRFDLRLVISDGSTLPPEISKMLKTKTFAGSKEISLPADFPINKVSEVVALNPNRVILRVSGQGPNASLADAFNRYPKIDAGAELRGLIKPNEAPNYLILKHLTTLIMVVETWTISDDFVKLMNRRG
jgi:hypothetical protein